MSPCVPARPRAARRGVARGVALAAALAAAGAPGEWSAVAQTCPLEIVGTWREAAAAPDDVVRLLRFSGDGWATVLEGSGERPAEDFEAVADVRYELEAERIVFGVRRGNDVFPPGTVLWDVVRHDDDSFAVVEPGAEAAERRWVRMPMRRYFVTFAARKQQGAGAAFVMLTTLDGRTTRRDALGAFETGAGDAAARFGRVPPELARAVVTDGDPETDVTLRLELNEAEQRRVRAVFEAWDVLLAAGVLAEEDPHRQALDLVRAVGQAVNRCRPRVRLPDAEHAEPGAADGAVRAFEGVRRLRQANERAHVSNRAFPSGWQPPAVGG